MARSEFIIYDDGDMIVTGEWTPSPDDAAARLFRLADHYDEMIEPLVMVQQRAIEITKEHFESEEGPDRSGWVPLTQEWIEDKRKQSSAFPESILRMTGTGYEAATSEDAWFITEDALFFDSSRLPEYMFYHQVGSASVEQTNVLKKLGRGELITSEEGRIFAQEGRGNNLPARPFIGFDEYDILEFEMIVDKWFGSQLLEEFPGGGGGGDFGMGYNILGEFPIIGFTSRNQPILRTPGGPRFGRMG